MEDLFNLQHFVKDLKQILLKGLPGEEVQYLMAPPGRPRPAPGGSVPPGHRMSAVLILLCRDEQDRIFIPLIQRRSYNGVHSAQVSFPGGKQEPGDQDLAHTAIRECREEIGPPGEIVIVGALSSLYIPVSGHLVHPFVGSCERPNPAFEANEREVSKIIRLYINDLMSGSLLREGLVAYGEGLSVRSPYFLVEELQVWGATAMILSELKALIGSIS